MKNSTEIEAREALAGLTEDFKMTLRQLKCLEDYAVDGRKIFRKHHRYPLWVALPLHQEYMPSYWVVRIVPAAGEDYDKYHAFEVPRRVFSNPLTSPVVQTCTVDGQELHQVEDFNGSKMLIPAKNLKVHDVAKTMCRVYGIDYAQTQVLPHIFGTADRWFAGLLLREKKGKFYCEYVVDLYAQKVYNRAGLELGETELRVEKKNPRFQFAHEIPLGYRQKAIRWQGMKIRFDAAKDVIEIKMIE